MRGRKDVDPHGWLQAVQGRKIMGLRVNHLSPNIHVQIFQTDLLKYISLKNKLRESGGQSKAFSLA